ETFGESAVIQRGFLEKMPPFPEREGTLPSSAIISSRRNSAAAAGMEAASPTEGESLHRAEAAETFGKKGSSTRQSSAEPSPWSSRKHQNFHRETGSRGKK